MTYNSIQNKYPNINKVHNLDTLFLTFWDKTIIIIILIRKYAYKGDITQLLHWTCSLSLLQNHLRSTSITVYRSSVQIRPVEMTLVISSQV